MNMTFAPVTADSEEKDILERINEEAIPECERNSLDDMLSTGAEITGIFLDSRPVGFLMYRRYKNICYLAYFAVEQSLRSNGIGGTALRRFLAENSDCQVFVEFEAPVDDCGSDDINLRRKGFYLRNGFNETGWFTYYDETELEIACSAKEADMEGFNEFIVFLGTLVSDHIPEPYRK